MSADPSVTSELVRDFVAQKRLALAGASRSGKKFGNVILRELKGRGYDVVPVHPEAAELEGLACARSLADARGPGRRPRRRDAAGRGGEARGRGGGRRGSGASGSSRGRGPPRPSRVARERGVSLVHGHCLLMFLPVSAGIHRFHRGLWRLLGKLPAEAALSRRPAAVVKPARGVRSARKGGGSLLHLVRPGVLGRRRRRSASPPSPWPPSSSRDASSRAASSGRLPGWSRAASLAGFLVIVASSGGVPWALVGVPAVLTVGLSAWGSSWPGGCRPCRATGGSTSGSSGSASSGRSSSSASSSAGCSGSSARLRTRAPGSGPPVIWNGF